MLTNTSNQAAGFIKKDDCPVEQCDPGITRQILGFDPHLMMVRVCFEKGAIGYVHTHPHRQASFVEKGSFEVQIEGEKKILRAGDGYFIPPNVPHGATALEDGVLIDVFTPYREDFLGK
jgi:quercetin dioxygenase-like cupin family protein